MCLFGGGSGKHESNTYLLEQQRREQQRQQLSEQSVAAINKTFDPTGRAGIYDNIYSTYRDSLTTDLNQQYQDILDQVKVGLARRGQFGSSADPYLKSKANKLYNEQLARIDSQAQGAKRSAMSDDQRLRGSLISQAWSGLNAGDASQIGLANLQSNAQNYLTRAGSASLGDVFSKLANQIGTGRQLGGRIAANNSYEDDNYSSYFGGGGSYGGQVA